jgi:hypothetical protein
VDHGEAEGLEGIEELAELADVGEGLCMPRPHQGLAALNLHISPAFVAGAARCGASAPAAGSW